MIPEKIIQALAVRYANRPIRAAVDSTRWLGRLLNDQVEGMGKALKSFREIRVEKVAWHTHETAMKERRSWLLIALFLTATRPRTGDAHRAGRLLSFSAINLRNHHRQSVAISAVQLRNTLHRLRGARWT